MGLYTITTRADGTVLTGFGSTSNIFNVDHENHVTHTEPESINSWEENVAQMNLTTDPAPAGVVSLAASMADELERLRFTLAAIKAAISAGTAPAQWYTATADGSFFPVLPTTAARMNAATTRTINSGATPTAIAWTVATETVYATPSSMATVIGLRAPTDGIYLVGARCSFGNITTTGPTLDARIVLRREELVVDTVDIQDIASQNVQSGGAGVPKSLCVEAIVQIAEGRRFSVAIAQTSGVAVAVTEGPSLWAALVGKI